MKNRNAPQTVYLAATKLHIAARYLTIAVSMLAGTLVYLSEPAYAELHADNACIRCHGSLPDRLGKPVALWGKSIHAENGIACNDCHGGDPGDEVNAMSPAKGFLGKPKEMAIPAFCGRCHIGILKQFQSSLHGRTVGKGGPTCVSCHSNHLVTKAALDIINQKECSRCHDSGRAMQIRAAMLKIETRIETVTPTIKALKEKGVDTEEMEKSLFSARNRFHTLFHELSLERIRVETSGIEAELSRLDRSIKDMEDNHRKRKLAGVAAIAAALMAAMLLRVYAKTFE